MLRYLSSVMSIVALVVLVGAACQTPVPSPPEPVERLNRSLIEAVRSNRIAEVKNLLSRGASADAIAIGTDYADTALIIAVRNRNLDTARLLLESGARVNLRQNDTHDGATPLIVAAALGPDEMVRLLLSMGANVQARTGFNGAGPGALYHAVRENHVGTVNLLLSEGAVVQSRELFAALENANVDVVARLLEAGADPYWRFSTGRTVLEEAQQAPAEVRDKMTAEIRRSMGQPHSR